MAQVFFNLPAPAANGSGAGVDVSSMGPLKTFAVSGGANCLVTIEMSNDPLGTFWTPVWTFQRGSAAFTTNLACRWLRATVSQFLGSTQPVVNVGGTNEGATFTQLVPPAGDGAGAAVDVSALGLFKTVHVGDDFRGSLQIEISEDGNTEWTTVFSFANPGKQSLSFAANWMRVARNGVPVVNPGLPTIYVGTTDPTSGDRGVAISAGTQSGGTGTVVFSNSNGISFGMSDSSIVTAQFDAIKSLVEGTVTASGPTIVFSNVNGLTFGISGNTITGSVQTAGGTATGVAISAGTEVATTGAVIFSNSNGVSFGLNAQTLTASVGAPLAISAGTQSVATGSVVFSNSNNITFGMSGSSRITASYYYPPVLRTVGFTATGGETQVTVTFTPAAGSTNYNVIAQLAGVSQLYLMDVPRGSRSVSQFVMIPGATMASNDGIEFQLFQSS